MAITNGVFLCRNGNLDEENAVKTIKSEHDMISIGLKSKFNSLNDQIKNDLRKKSEGIFTFLIKDSESSEAFFIDLKNPKVSLELGQSQLSDIVIETDKKTFIDLMNGKIKGQSAFMKGLVKVKGNMMLATKLDSILKVLSARPESKI